MNSYDQKLTHFADGKRFIRLAMALRVDSSLAGGDLMLRQQLREFEGNLASFVGTKYAVGVSNCTDGMPLSLLAAGIGSGDEVITVSHTIVATAAVIHHTGANSALVDIVDHHNMGVDCAEAVVTHRTRAVIPVDLNSRLCDMVRLMSLAERAWPHNN